MKRINILLTTISFMFLVYTGNAQCDPVAAYNLDNDALDISGNSFHGTNNGASATVNRFNLPLTAMSFDGSSDYIELPDDFDFIERSINLWFKAESSASTAKTIYDSDHPGMINGSTKIYIMNYNSVQSLCFSTGSGSTNFHAEPITLNQWHMATLVVGSDVRFYLDGNLIATFGLHGGNSAAGNNTALFGCTRLFDRFFDGDIDDVSIYDCALSQLEIGNLYNDHKVFGMVYQDFNQNCIQEGNEVGVGGRMAIINPGNIVVQTGVNGIWSVDSLPAGSYTITYDSTGNWMPTCSPVMNFTIVNADSTTITPFFGVLSTQPCPSPAVSIVMPFIRRCFTNQNIYVHASNEMGGTDVLSNGYVDLTIDPLLTITSSSNSYTSLGNDLYRFDLNDNLLYPGETESITISTTVSCNAVLNQTLCVEGELFPVAACVYDTIPADDPLDFTPCSLPWDQSSISVDGWCDNDTIYFTITNTGDPIDGDMECYSPIRLFIDGVYIYLDSIMLTGGDIDTLVFAGDGRTWRLEVDQHPLHPGNSNPNATVELCGNAANWTPNLVTILPQNDADPVVDIYCGLVTGSYDPNDKTGYPLGVTVDHFITPNGKLDYLIRFQNTGTDTAFIVVVRDTLDMDLNIFSVNSGVSSHDYSFRMYGQRVLEWTFNNILLPDSTTDEPGSNGFVMFSVNQMPDLPDGTEINNNVGIYFDYNAPVITNTTSHIINRNIGTAGWQEQITMTDSSCFNYNLNGIEYLNSGNYFQVNNDTLINLSLFISSPDVSATASADSICLGESVILTGVGTSGYSWSGGVIDGQSFNPVNSQMYFITVQDSYDCTDSDSVYVFVNSIVPSAGYLSNLNSSTLEFTVINQSTDADTWGWYIDGSLVSTSQDMQYLFTQNGTYNVCLIASNDCFSDSTCKQVTVTTVGINEINGDQFVISPNPVSDLLTINLSSKEDLVNYTIIDGAGRVIRNGNLSGNNIDVSELSNGIYFLDLNIDGNSYRKKFIKN